MSSIKRQKGGWRFKAGRRQTLFIRGKNLKDCVLTYCQRTGAQVEEFDESLKEIFGDLEVKPKEPDLPEEDPEGEHGDQGDLPEEDPEGDSPDGEGDEGNGGDQGDLEEDPSGAEKTEAPEGAAAEEIDEDGAPKEEPETIDEVVVEVEEAGEEVPTLEAKLEE